MQRVFDARVRVDDEVVGAIGRGLLVYLGAGRDDDERDVEYTVAKISGLRIFQGDDGRMTQSVTEIDGEVLVVSQFTLYGDVRKGRRPSFTDAAEPALAESLYERAVRGFAALPLRVATGRFRAMMTVESRGDGPVTIMIDSRRGF